MCAPLIGPSEYMLDGVLMLTLSANLIQSKSLSDLLF